MINLSDISSGLHIQELMHLALNRGKLLEELALEGMVTGIKADRLFLFGLLSLLDIMLDLPFPAILGDLPLSVDFQEGHLDADSDMGRYLQLLLAVEDNNIAAIVENCHHLNLTPQAVMEATIRAHAWTEGVICAGL